jgi:hypothetical protein
VQKLSELLPLRIDSAHAAQHEPQAHTAREPTADFRSMSCSICQAVRNDWITVLEVCTIPAIVVLEEMEGQWTSITSTRFFAVLLDISSNSPRGV